MSYFDTYLEFASFLEWGEVSIVYNMDTCFWTYMRSKELQLGTLVVVRQLAKER